MRNFRINIDIAAPPDRVWEVMSDVDRWHEWTPSVTSIKRVDDTPVAVGTKRESFIHARRSLRRVGRFQETL